MTSILGVVVVFVMVFGGYTLAGGKFGIIIYALPFEMMMIGGAALGAFLCANSMHDIKHTLGGLSKVVKGGRYAKQDYSNILSLLYYFVRLAQTKGPMALEAHIEKPQESAAFQKFPKILADHHATDLICDYLRMVGMNADDPHQIEDIMAGELKKLREEEMHPGHALQTVADGLPALGIVAAVLGIIKTMGSINEPPEVLGRMIGGALVGTFLGVFLAYGLVGPMAARLKEIVDSDGAFYKIIQSVLVAHLHGNAAQISVEIGRGDIPSGAQPSFSEMEESLANAPMEAA